MQEVAARTQTCEEEFATCAGRSGGCRSGDGCGERSVITCDKQLHSHTAHALARIRLAIAVQVHKHHVANAHWRVEAEVDGEVAVLIIGCVDVGVLAQFRIEVCGLRSRGEREHGGPHASDTWVRRIVSVLVRVIIQAIVTALPWERNLAHELAIEEAEEREPVTRRHLHEVTARRQVAKVVAPTAAGLRGSNEVVVVWVGRRGAVKPKRHTVDALTGIKHTIAIHIVIHRIAHAHFVGIWKGEA